jgi:hypothetical protein
MDFEARGELLGAFFIASIYYPGFLSICLPEKTSCCPDSSNAVTVTLALDLSTYSAGHGEGAL